MNCFVLVLDNNPHGGVHPVCKQDTCLIVEHFYHAGSNPPTPVMVMVNDKNHSKIFANIYKYQR